MFVDSPDIWGGFGLVPLWEREVEYETARVVSSVMLIWLAAVNFESGVLVFFCRIAELAFRACFHALSLFFDLRRMQQQAVEQLR